MIIIKLRGVSFELTPKDRIEITDEIAGMITKLFGFKRHIIHGMYSASRILAQFPKKIEEAHQFDVAFKTPIFLPSQVICRHQQVDNKIVVDVVDKTQTQPHLKGILI